MSNAPKLKIKSISGMERANRRNVIVFSFIAVVIAFLAVQVFLGKQTEYKKPVKPVFSDTTPSAKSSEQITIARLQKTIEEQAKTSSQSQQRLQKELEALSDRLEKNDQLNKKTVADMNKKMLLLDMKKATATTASAQTQPKAIVVDNNGSPYLMPPATSGDKPGIVMPPPVQLGQDVPAAQNQPQASMQSAKTNYDWTKLPQPIVMSGGDDHTSANVLAGEKTAEEERSEKGSFLPMGAFANVVIMTGADFGAGQSTQSNPQPALMRIMDDAILPNDARYQLRHCAAIGSGYGEMSSERVYISITRLSCVDIKSGRVLEASVLGYVADSDGKLGLRGKLVNREGAILAKAMLAGFAKGAGDILSTQAQNLQSSVTGSGVVTTMNTDDLGKASGYAGASNAMDMLAKRYLDQAQAIFPVIEVDSGRKATIIIQQGQLLKWRIPGEEKQK